MGNNNSFMRKLQGNSAKKVADEDENDDDDDDYEHWKVEVCECKDEESDTDSCKTDHSKYIMVEDLIVNTNGNGSLEMLPEDIRHKSVLEYIQILEKLVVRIRVNARIETSKYHYFGTGCVYVSSSTLAEYSSCPLEKCVYNNGQVHKSYGSLIVYTNKHVIHGNLEAGSCNIDFFYYKPEYEASDIVADTNEAGDQVNDTTAKDEIEAREIAKDEIEAREIAKDENEVEGGSDNKNEAGCFVKVQNEAEVVRIDNQDVNGNNLCSNILHKRVTAYGYTLREDQDNKDLVGLRILCHDKDLYTTISRYCELRVGAWSKIPDKIKQRIKKHAIIISHPHGDPKKISFGNLVSLEESDRRVEGRKVTKYNAATCEGSSGAPVLTGHYSYRPFVHSSKGKKLGISFSY